MKARARLARYLLSAVVAGVVVAMGWPQMLERWSASSKGGLMAQRCADQCEIIIVTDRMNGATARMEIELDPKKI